MKFEPQRFNRKSIRLKGYDYSQAGVYYFTIVAQLRKCFFGEIRDGEMIFNDAGRMVNTAWEALPKRFPNIELDIFQLMPNHFHGIIAIHDDPVGATLVVAPDGAGTRADGAGTRADGAGTRPAPTKPTLGDIIGAFKSITTHEYIHGVDEMGWAQFYKRLWQRNYYEYIIRNNPEWDKIHRYIQSNPSIWAEDEENPAIPRKEHL